jgi:hypothetical protein
VGWVYYLRLVDTKFQADCLKARLEDAEGWLYRKVPKYIGVYRTPSGRYGVKILW